MFGDLLDDSSEALVGPDSAPSCEAAATASLASALAITQAVPEEEADHVGDLLGPSERRLSEFFNNAGPARITNLPQATAAAISNFVEDSPSQYAACCLLSFPARTCQKGL